MKEWIALARRGPQAIVVASVEIFEAETMVRPPGGALKRGAQIPPAFNSRIDVTRWLLT